MTNAMSRRRALGTLSLGALLAACSSDDGNRATSTTDRATTSSGGTTASTAGPTTADLFDDAASCTLSPAMTEGPFYFDVDAIRSDIRDDREGTALRLAIRVRDAASCEPLADGVVDIWHCDAVGNYSGFEAASTGGGGPGGGVGRTDDETYLRGAQVTNGDGVVEFATIYPGWYPGRTVHIHAKVHLDNTTLLTTQLFFDEEATDAVYLREPYLSDGTRDTFNLDDSIFDDQLVLTLSEEGDGYLGVITIDVDR